jgi:hypothetical protein
MSLEMAKRALDASFARFGVLATITPDAGEALAIRVIDYLATVRPVDEFRAGGRASTRRIKIRVAELVEVGIDRAPIKSDVLSLVGGSFPVKSAQIEDRLGLVWVVELGAGS